MKAERSRESRWLWVLADCFRAPPPLIGRHRPFAVAAQPMAAMRTAASRGFAPKQTSMRAY